MAKICTRVNIYHIFDIYKPGPSDGDIFWTLLNILVILVQMKGLGVYYDCAKAEFLTPFGPRAMGPSPPEAQGLIIVLYNILWGAEGAQKYPNKLKESQTL